LPNTTTWTCPPLAGKVLIVDDVITAGTAARDAQQIVNSAGADVAGLVISLDRQEVGKDSRSAVQEVEQTLRIRVISIIQVEQTLRIRVISIIQLEDLIDLLEESPEYNEFLDPCMKYRKKYGIDS
jgi:orotate phosphoribosyltransferase